MTKKEKFLMLVQTAAIVADIQTHREISATVLYDAMGISESIIPAIDMGYAVREFINYEYGKINGGVKSQKPDWLGKDES